MVTTASPSASPSRSPTRAPSHSPTHHPSHSPSHSPSRTPSSSPHTSGPSQSPTPPTHYPTSSPVHVSIPNPQAMAIVGVILSALAVLCAVYCIYMSRHPSYYSTRRRSGVASVCLALIVSGLTLSIEGTTGANMLVNRGVVFNAPDANSMMGVAGLSLSCIALFFWSVSFWVAQYGFPQFRNLFSRGNIKTP